ncbi:oligopeptide/dipeptide ABC transporter ATP-binding protein [Microlunatus soli]|uniref:Peptide/nickel transport system ATP-binding protein n=1 Tax=Microlunatus soli TaxID=630515 RepID=A0A1H1T7P6_9ACTN|nr:ABC transporter ATP-binding protein [Microlunatus soli]SDS56168.1 peptide/nickel transport system ATP-binding protein [Microlunatus soli]
MTAGLTVQDLTVRYGQVTAVDDISFSVAPGTVLGLVGESGSGKSTAARAVVGLAPAQGSIMLDNVDLGRLPGRQARRERRRLQMIFQDSRSALDPRFTVAQCVAEGLPSASGVDHGRPDPARDAPRRSRGRIAELLELVSLDTGLMNARPRALSGGQRQRVAIARALAAEPDVLVADEVTASLDVSVQAVVLNLLRRLQADLGLTMIFISHNLSVVRYMADQIAVMYDGRIVEQGPTADLIAGPEHPCTRSLLAAIPQMGQRRLLSDEGIEASVVSGPASAPGCAYRLRCPIGPAASSDGREICTSTDPMAEAFDRHHQTACHFASVGS